MRTDVPRIGVSCWKRPFLPVVDVRLPPEDYEPVVHADDTACGRIRHDHIMGREVENFVAVDEKLGVCR